MIKADELSKEEHKQLYSRMLECRIFEETAVDLFETGKIHGTAHYGIGEEASTVGVGVALKKNDYIFQTHRGHHQGIAKGMELKKMMAEFMGKKTGCCKGLGGSMHIADYNAGSLGANGIVAGGLPLAVGAALKQKYNNEPNITACFFGDGASNEGAFHESLNLASIWKLPNLFVCVNNQYGMSTSVKKSMLIEKISTRALSYGIKGIELDGNDVITIYKKVKELRNWIIDNGPALIVLDTYRWKGHSKSDKQSYRTKEEVAQWIKKCPIKKHEQYMIENCIVTKEEIDKIEKQVHNDIFDAVNFAENSPELELNDAFNYVYAD